MNTFDQLHRYLFNQAHVRGELVRLKDSYQAILQNNDYPKAVQQLLGELMAATSLLTATLKFEGDIAIQLQGEGSVNYAVINGTHDQQLRGVARWQGEINEYDFATMFKKGIMVITINPEEGERYQGVVSLDKPSLEECLEQYFDQSEQLPTKVILKTNQDNDNYIAAGMLLQVLPVEYEKSREDFEHLSKLTETISADELFELEAEDLLYRLYHQEEVELFTPQDIVFKCTCSKERSAGALANIEKQELMEIIAKEGCISMNCQYCHSSYQFDAIDVEAIHSGHYGESQQHQ